MEPLWTVTESTIEPEPEKFWIPVPVNCKEPPISIIPLFTKFAPPKLRVPEVATPSLSVPPAFTVTLPLTPTVWLLMLRVAPLAMTSEPPIVLLLAVVIPVFISIGAVTKDPAFIVDVPCIRMPPTPPIVPADELSAAPFIVRTLLPVATIPPVFTVKLVEVAPLPSVTLLANVTIEPEVTVKAAVFVPTPERFWPAPLKLNEPPVIVPLLTMLAPPKLTDPEVFVTVPPALTVRSPWMLTVWFVELNVAPFDTVRGPPMVVLDGIVVPLAILSGAVNVP